MGCVQAVVGNKVFWIQFEDGQSKYMSTGSLTFILAKEEVGKGGEDMISDMQKNLKVIC